MKPFSSYKVPENDVIDQIDLNLSTSSFGIQLKNPSCSRVCIAHDHVIFSINANPIREITIPPPNLETDILLHIYKKLAWDWAFRLPQNLTGFELLVICQEKRGPLPFDRFGFIRQDGHIVEINTQNIKIYHVGEQYNSTVRINDPRSCINISE